MFRLRVGSCKVLERRERSPQRWQRERAEAETSKAGAAMAFGIEYQTVRSPASHTHDGLYPTHFSGVLGTPTEWQCAQYTTCSPNIEDAHIFGGG